MKKRERKKKSGDERKRGRKKLWVLTFKLGVKAMDVKEAKSFKICRLKKLSGLRGWTDNAPKVTES